jgi:hypothetical protein
MIILFAETIVSLGKHTAHKQQAAFLIINSVQHPILGKYLAGLTQNCGQGSSGGKANDYPPGGGGEIFRNCPDRPGGTRSLLYNVHRVLPGCKAAWA